MNLAEFNGLQACYGERIVYKDSNGCYCFEMYPTVDTRSKQLIDSYGEKSEDSNVYVSYHPQNNVIFNITVKDLSCIDPLLDGFISDYLGDNMFTDENDW